SNPQIRFTEIIMFSLIGIGIALPWHIYMVVTHGSQFVDYLLGYHIFKRATEGIGRNEKPSGYFYYISIIMNNIPFGIVIFYLFVKDAMKIRSLNWEKLLMWSWFVTGFVIISIFRTKIDTYLMQFLVPLCILVS